MKHWRLYRHADPTPIAGWMMLAAREHRSGLEALQDLESAEIGLVLRALAKATQEVTGADRIYSITYNEAVQHFHLHIIPRFATDDRTKSWALADFYRSVASGTTPAIDSNEATRIAEKIAAQLRALLPNL